MRWAEYCLLFCFSGALAAQSGGPETIPESLKRPQLGEGLRYPQDTIIGPLGPGTAPEPALQFARNFLQGLLARDPEAPIFTDADPAFLRELFEALGAVEPRRFRLGGGREEPDGSVSFLVRFIGRDQWIAGELYLQFSEDQWNLDDIVLEKPREIGQAGPEYRFDFSPYERFF